MLDLVIRGDRVVTPQGVGAFDVAVEGERIVAVAATGTFGKETTRRLIDFGQILDEAMRAQLDLARPGTAQSARNAR